MKKLLLLLLVFTLINNVSYAQANIWGAGASSGSSDGEFSSAFVNATSYSAGDNPTSWTALTIYDNAATPGSAYWNRSITGTSQGAHWGTRTAIGSPSQANGVALFDSDFMDNAGVANSYGTGSSPSFHKGELISPRFDATGYSDSIAGVKFYSYYSFAQLDELSVSFSTDDGSTWSQAVDIRSFQKMEEKGFVTATFPGAFMGLFNLTQCRIKFTFEGSYYFAMIDDVTIMTVGGYSNSDGVIGIQENGGNGLADVGTQVHLSNNRYFPISQITDDQFQFYGANVKGDGYAGLAGIPKPYLEITVQKDIAGIWTNVYTDSVLTGDLPPLSSVAHVTDTFTTLDWVEAGDFRTIYNIVSPFNKFTDNDTIMHYFSFTNDDYASKVGIDESGNPEMTTSKVPNGQYRATEWGAVFNFPTAGTQDLGVESISFKYYVPNDFTGSDTQTYYVRIHEFVDANNNGLDQIGELTLIGSQSITLVGLTSAKGTINTATVSNILDTSNAPLGALQDNKQYYFTVLTDLAKSGGPYSYDSKEVIRIGASTTKNYSMNGENNPRPLPSPIVTTDLAETLAYRNGYGMDVIPSIGVNLYNVCVSKTTLKVTMCGSYTWANTNMTYTTSGNYYDTLKNVANCDSIIKLELTIYDGIYNSGVSPTEMSYCDEGSTAITIDTSVLGINYSLRNDADNSVIDGPLAGNTSPLTFNTGNITESTNYHVFAQRTSDTSGLEFDGINDYVDTKIDISHDTLPNLTIEGWVYPTRTNYIARQVVFSHDDYFYDRGLIIEFNTSMWTLATGSSFWEAAPVDLNQWQHVAIVYNHTAQTLKFYKNGVEYVYSGTTSYSTSDSTLWLGRNPRAGEPFEGKIDEVRIWNVERTASQISDHYKSLNANTTEGLVASYNFASGNGTQAMDESLNGNDISLTNADTTSNATWTSGGNNVPLCDKEMDQEVTITVGSTTSITVDTTINVGESVTVGSNAYNEPGNYVDTLTSAQNCDSIVTTNLTVIGGITSSFNGAISVYPNPTEGNVQLSISHGTVSNLSYKLYDLRGQLLDNNLITQPYQTIELNKLPNSIYLLEVYDDGGQVKQFKVIKH